MMGKVISYFTPGSVMAKTEARIYGGAMVAVVFIRLTFDHHYNYLTSILGMRVRTACCSLLYRKVSPFKCVALQLSKMREHFKQVA
jgi:ATP-binding cassette subfamily C (CFTR/MRP) protein 4